MKFVLGCLILDRTQCMKLDQDLVNLKLFFMLVKSNSLLSPKKSVLCSCS